MKNYRYLLLILFAASFAFNRVNAAHKGATDETNQEDSFFDGMTLFQDFPILTEQDLRNILLGTSDAEETQQPEPLPTQSSTVIDAPEIERIQDTASAQPVLQQASNPQTYPYPAKRFQCIVCLTGCASKDALDKHTKTHTGERSFKCSHEGCNAAFALSCALTRHTRTHIEIVDAMIQQPEVPSIASTVICSSNICTFDGCNKSFATKYNLKTHTRIHTGDKPFKCTVGCNASFTQKVHLIKHEKKHTGEKPFRCTFVDCEKGFFDSNALVDHTRKHTGQKNACTFAGCSATFTRMRDWKKHEREKHNLLELTHEDFFVDQFDHNND